MASSKISTVFYNHCRSWKREQALSRLKRPRSECEEHLKEANGDWQEASEGWQEASEDWQEANRRLEEPGERRLIPQSAGGKRVNQLTVESQSADS